jgi:tetratricopeptide (TPR) repeat protein
VNWRTPRLWILAVLCVARALVSQDLNSRIRELHVEAQAAEKAGRLDVALQKYEAILDLNPDLAPAYNNLGKVYYLQGRYQEAIKVLRRALELDPQLAPPRALLGISLYQLGDLKGASRELREALKLSPGDRIAKYYLAQSFSELGEHEKASEILKDLQREDPQNAEFLYSLAYAYLELASATLGKLRSAKPDSYLIDLFQGKTAEGKGRYTEAIQNYRNAVAKAPDVQGLHYALGHVLSLNGQFPEALQEFRLELRLNPNNYLANWQAAERLVRIDPQEALRFATRALELKPDLAEALLTRGRVLLALKRAQEAIQDLKRSAALDPADEKVHFQLSRAYRQIGLTEAAEVELARFERMNKAGPSDEEPSPSR